MNTKPSNFRPVDRLEVSATHEVIRRPELFRRIDVAEESISPSTEQHGGLRRVLQTCLRYFNTYFRE
ncbi:MAG: hypothetical protein ACE14M_16105 [Terriglobales bacterium]